MNQFEFKHSKYFKDKYKWLNKVRKIQKSLQYNPDPNAKVIHHLRDTEEQRKYNDEHYELWGFEIDENGNEVFTYCKYVVFVTKEEHDTYHQSSEETRKKISDGVKKALNNGLREKRVIQMTGENNPQYGKVGPMSTCFGRCGNLHPMYGKQSAFKGRHHSEESIQKLKDARRKTVEFHNEQYNNYILVGGKLRKTDFIKILSQYRKSTYWLPFSFDEFTNNCKDKLGL